MMVLSQNKQVMYYVKPIGTQVVYELDSEGNKILDYTDEEGNEYYRETGETDTIYSEPIKFLASISSSLSEMHMKAWGIDQSSIYCEIVCSKGELSLPIGSLVWRTSPIQYRTDNPEQVAANSSDYTVMGIMDEFLNDDWFLLRKNNVDV